MDIFSVSAAVLSASARNLVACCCHRRRRGGRTAQQEACSPFGSRHSIRPQFALSLASLWPMEKGRRRRRRDNVELETRRCRRRGGEQHGGGGRRARVDARRRWGIERLDARVGIPDDRGDECVRGPIFRLRRLPRPPEIIRG